MRSEQIPVNEEERRKLLVEWNQTTRDYPQAYPLHALFEAQAEHSPDSVAVVFGDASLTYRELNGRANQLAHYLQGLGVGPERLVGLCVERGLDLLVGILGILKAGGTYLPLDPGYPAERLRFMLGDSCPPFVITQAGLEKCLPEYQGKVLFIDTDWPAIAGQTEENPAAGISGDSLAYVIYTSGTTGQPKGTLLEQRGLSNVSAEQIRYFGVGPGSRVLQFSSPNFDASLFDIVMALTTGATLVLARQEDLLPGTGLVKLLRDQGITILTVPPSVLNVLPPSSLPDLQVINVAGEACSADLVSRWAPGRRFFNLYGPTECTIWTTAAECQPADRLPSIGRPIGNTRVYILDEELQPVPIGVPGELFVGGVGIARGYLKREELTREKFLADPFNASPGARLYRTGDRVRYLDDGNIEFLGRVDEQVKIRGFRVEPGEVEAVLGRQSGVETAIVLVREDEPGDKRLVAYVVPERGQSPVMDDLRDRMQEILPAYMVPSVIVPLDKLPLTLNGKLDRQALPVPNWSRSTSDPDYQPPRNSVEKLLAGVYAEVLGIENVGVDDNFYELGGHSLNISRLIARVRDIFHVEIPFRSVFENPVLSMLAADLQERMRDGNSSEPFNIEPVKSGESLPLSYSQERVWFVQHLDKSSKAYNAQATIHWYGQLDVSALERGLTEMVRRHEVLRTTFVEENGTPVQRIHEAMPVTLRIVNLESSDTARREEQISALLQEAFQELFDVTRLPLIRWTLIRLGEAEHLMTHVEHHLIHDGWSFNVFLSELLALYKAYHDGKPSPLADPRIQFADFARWQRRWMQGEEVLAQLAYWKERLAGCQPLLELPYDMPRPAVQSFRGAAPRFELPVTLCEGIEHTCRELGVTPFMTFLTGLLILLYRYSSQEDICIGTGMANRRWQETEGLLGMIINNVVLRVDVSGNPSVHRLLGRVRECTLDASANQDLPFEKVVEALQPERSLSYNPLFQIMFGMHDSPMPQQELPGLTGELDLAVANGGAKFDLTVVVVPDSAQRVGWPRRPGSESWTVIWEYNTDLFDDATISRMTHHYQTILESMVAAPEQRVAELPLMSASEQRQLLLDWNRTATAYPRDKTVAELFEAQAASIPEAVAVVYEGRALSYGELNVRANRLAHYLRAQGVGPEVMVGVYLERDLEMVVALLGILKAGGAYVPLDLDYPASRLAFMLDDAQAPVLISMSSLQDQLPAFDGELICLDTDWPAIEQESAENPSPTAAADNLAYVIYTSGSTGTSKGVAVPQRAINRLVCETDYFQVAPGDRVAQASNVSFDAATFEVWAALLNGAQLVGVSKDVLLNPQALSTFLNEQGITALFITTALFNLMAREVPQAFSGLRGLMFGGEAVDAEAVRRVQSSAPPERLLHVYGPTECTTFASWHRVEAVSVVAATVPIGRPISNTSAYILDEQRHPVPVGVPGELYLGGDGLARGYLNRPELTDEKFVADPFSEDPRARLYRTGDRVRYRCDGAIEFLGRFDHQVKVRGFRIELGEIEAVLEQQPELEAAIVLLREDDPDDKRLVAYVVPVQGQSPDTDELRARLQQILPAYMMPSMIVSLDALPLTPNGKVDRDALPLPDQPTLQSKQAFVEPHTEVEQQLAQIWSEVLNLDRVGVHDNFFDLGGHSLVATQVVSRVREVIGIELPLTELFTHTTISELARVIESPAAEGHVEETAITAIQPVDRTNDMPLSFAQQRLWFLDQLEPGSTVYNIPVTIRLQGTLNIKALQQSLQEILNRHESLRTAFYMRDGQPLQVIMAEQEFVLPVEDLHTLSKEARTDELKKWMTHEALQPFDLATDVKIRARLLHIDDDEHFLLLTMHHIASDGLSLGVLFRELGVLYKSFSHGRVSPLPALSVQYPDYASWQRNWFSGKVLERQLSYWKAQLAGAAVLELPLDRPRPAVQSFAGAREVLQLSAELSGKLEDLAQQQGATLFMTALATFAILLNKYTHQEDVVVGSPIANRHQVEIEDLIGFFVNTLVLRMDMSDDPTFPELLHRVKKVALGAYEHQDMPFEMLVDELSPVRDRSRNPLFQVLFAVQNEPFSELSLEGISLETTPGITKTTHFDLETSLWPNSNGLAINIVYNTSLFNAETIRRMLGHYLMLLEGVVNNPNSRLSELDLLTEDEQQMVIGDWNQTTTDYPRNKTVHELFEQQVSETPDAIAVEFDSNMLNYQQLNQRANKLAHYLRERGVGPEVMVVLYLERSLEMVVGLLAILKAGGVYVPLDPSYPRERFAFILKDARAPVLLTQERLRAKLPQTGAEVVCLDSGWEAIAGHSAANPSRETGPENLAYVIYTSGSTGEPKGVAVPHRAICNHMLWMQDALPLTETDKELQNTPSSFDVSICEFFAPLMAGAQLVMARPEAHKDVHYLANVIAEQQITRLQVVPSMLQALLDEGLIEGCHSLRQVLCGGETLLPELQKCFFACHHAELYNLYGPTEATIDATFWQCDRHSQARTVPIGRPISNTTVYILDRQMNPVPIGVPGELYIGGDGLARCYLNREQLTAEKFVPDPFSDNAQARLYRTGDKVRYRTDGAIEFIGRFDHQVKVRGFRIELGEIEAHLARHKEVKDSVVMVREDEPGDRHLVAYVVVETDSASTLDAIRRHIRASLPAFMVPSVFVLLDKLPLTANGKVDRSALPAPSDESRVTNSYVAPRTEIEQRLVEIWQNILPTSKVGVFDNFFDLGGHSLMATRVISRIRKSEELDLSVATMFDYPTIAALAKIIDAMQWARQGHDEEHVDPQGNRQTGEL